MEEKENTRRGHPPPQPGWYAARHIQNQENSPHPTNWYVAYWNGVNWHGMPLGQAPWLTSPRHAGDIEWDYLAVEEHLGMRTFVLARAIERPVYMPFTPDTIVPAKPPKPPEEPAPLNLSLVPSEDMLAELSRRIKRS